MIQVIAVDPDIGLIKEHYAPALDQGKLDPEMVCDGKNGSFRQTFGILNHYVENMISLYIYIFCLYVYLIHDILRLYVSFLKYGFCIRLFLVWGDLLPTFASLFGRRLGTAPKLQLRFVFFCVWNHARLPYSSKQCKCFVQSSHSTVCLMTCFNFALMMTMMVTMMMMMMMMMSWFLAVSLQS